MDVDKWFIKPISEETRKQFEEALKLMEIMDNVVIENTKENIKIIIQKERNDINETNNN